VKKLETDRSALCICTKGTHMRVCLHILCVRDREICQGADMKYTALYGTCTHIYVYVSYSVYVCVTGTFALMYPFICIYTTCLCMHHVPQRLHTYKHTKLQTYIQAYIYTYMHTYMQHQAHVQDFDTTFEICMHYFSNTCLPFISN
jgi:hypothetical protein